MSINPQLTIEKLRHRAAMLRQFVRTDADNAQNARAFRQSEQIWRNQGYPEIAIVAGAIASTFELEMTLPNNAPPPSR